jgi:hypothetical protein
MLQNNNKNPRRPIFQNFHWSSFAVSEGIFKTVHMWIFKIIGSTFAAPLFFVSTFVVGVIQIVGGLLVNLRSRYEIFPKTKYIIGSLLLGVIAVYTAVVPMYIFSISGASLALIAFIISLILIPKALFDKVLFRDPITPFQLMSVPLFLFGLYALVGFPGFDQITSLPSWAWFALTLPVAIIAEEFLTRSFKVGVISPWVKNFWIGVSTVVVSVISFIVIKPFSILLDLIKNLSGDMWFLFVLLGLSILTGVFVKQRTYMHGGSIAAKKITMIGTYLISSLVVGVLFFTNPLTIGEIVGIFALITGYFFVEQETFNQFLFYLRKASHHE